MHTQKKVFDERCKYRVSDFEIAAKRSDLKIYFSSFTYYAKTLFIWEACGIVTYHSSRIRVVWNYSGLAFIGTERMPEFDLNFV